VSAAALLAVNGILERGGDADDVLRAVVEALVEDGCRWAGILFVEGGELTLGPEAGTAAPETRTGVPVLFQGTNVAELAVDGFDDELSLARIAALIAPYCLVGWDTGGIPWDAA
jgi:hypothetical protein